MLNIICLYAFMFLGMLQYVKPKPISHQNQKLAQQHNCKKFLQPTRSKCYLQIELEETL
jgi:hypothetical protein